jgi:hypothetical protein
MARSLVRPAAVLGGTLLALLHFRLEDMPGLDAELDASVLFDITEHFPVPGVIGLDKLKAPAAGDGVPPDQGLLDVAGECGMPRLALA